MQKIIQGRGAVKETGEIISTAGKKNVFLITGNHYREEEEFRTERPLQLTHYIKKGQNVDDSEVTVAWEKFSANSFDAIAAIGGGSVIDLAKAIIHREINAGGPTPFFLAVPTTAGSGSEATQFAVLYKSGKKLSLNDPALLPKAVILDASLVETVSSYQAAVSGMDVLSQAVESLWSRFANEESKQYANEAIQLWKDSFLPVVNKKSSDDFEKMLKAAHLAGKAINITRTTGPHALSYYLTAHHGIPHGQAVSLFLPLFFLYNKPSGEICSLLGAADYENAKTNIQSVMRQAGLAVTLAELMIDKDIIVEKLVDEVNEERFSNNPVPFDRQGLIELIIRYL